VDDLDIVARIISRSLALASSCARCGAIKAKSLALSRRNRLLVGRPMSSGAFFTSRCHPEVPLPRGIDNN
jgi:hypothetical protein